MFVEKYFFLSILISKWIPKKREFCLHVSNSSNTSYDICICINTVICSERRKTFYSYAGDDLLLVLVVFRLNSKASLSGHLPRGLRCSPQHRGPFIALALISRLIRATSRFCIPLRCPHAHTHSGRTFPFNPMSCPCSATRTSILVSLRR